MSAGTVLGTYPLPPTVGGSLADISQLRACLAPLRKEGSNLSLPQGANRRGDQTPHSPGRCMAWDGEALKGVHGELSFFYHQGTLAFLSRTQDQDLWCSEHARSCHLVLRTAVTPRDK